MQITMTPSDLNVVLTALHERGRALERDQKEAAICGIVDYSDDIAATRALFWRLRAVADDDTARRVQGGSSLC